MHLKEKICKLNTVSYVTVEVDELGHNDRSFDYEIKRQEAI